MKKALSIALASVLALGALVACGKPKNDVSSPATPPPAGNSSPATSTPAGEQTTIKMALWDYETVGYDRALIEAFEAENPQYKVEVISAPNADYEQKITTMLTGGDDIDVFLGKSNTAYPTYVLNGFAMELDTLIKEKGFDIAPFGTVLDQHYRVDGKLYAIPYRTNDWVIYYNKGIFDAANVPYPTNNMTWEEYREIAAKVTSGTGAEKIYGAGYIPKMGFVMPSLIGKDEKFDLMTSSFEFMKEPIQYYVDLQDKDQSYENYAISASMNQDQTYFYKGQTAMLFNGSWFTQMLADSTDKYNFEWGIAKSPYWQGNSQRGFATSTPVLINAKTKNVDAAWDLMAFLTGEEGATTMAENKMVPSYMTDATMDIYKATTAIDDDSFAALTGNKTYCFGPADVLMNRVSGMMNEELELVITGNQSIDECIENMTKRRQEIIDQKS